MYRSPEEYEFITKTIIQIYLDYNIKGFPLDEKDICRRLGVSLIPYSEFSKVGIKLLKKRSMYGFYVKGYSNIPPTIYYNDMRESVGAIRFTIFHEIKHYVFNEDVSNEEEDDLADFFARYFMCPIPYVIIKNILSKNEIISGFGLSDSAASNVVSNIRNRRLYYGKKIFDNEVPLLEHLDIDAFEVFNMLNKENNLNMI